MSENRARMARALADRGFRKPPPPLNYGGDPYAPVDLGMGMASAPRPMPAPMPAPRLDPDGDHDASPNVNHDETNDNDASWEIGDSFTPEGLKAAAGEGARWWGEILKPVATGAADLGGRVMSGVRQFGDNLAQRDAIDQGMAEHYMPQIRAASGRANDAMSELANRTSTFIGNLDSAESDMDELTAAIRGPSAPLPFRGMPAPAPYPDAASEEAEVAASMTPETYGAPGQPADRPIDPRQMTDEQLLAALRANGARRAMR